MVRLDMSLAGTRWIAIVLTFVLAVGGVVSSIDGCEMTTLAQGGPASFHVACQDHGRDSDAPAHHGGAHCACTCHQTPLLAVAANLSAPRIVGFIGFPMGAELLTRSDAPVLQPPIAG